MPELPEVEAIAAVASRYSIGESVIAVETLRHPTGHPYFGALSPLGATISGVHRRGKWVVFQLSGGPAPYMTCHNAMTGYWDYEHEPWTFDYVEGRRAAGGSDVRLRLHLRNGRILRFHDARLFGRVDMIDRPPMTGPELIDTPMLLAGSPVISLEGFARGILSSKRSVKETLMDQGFLAGVGNIYANEACHLASIDPRIIGRDLYPETVPVLFESLRFSVSRCIPEVTYGWLNVYRRKSCGSCSRPVLRTEVAGRATFICESCQ